MAGIYIHIPYCKTRCTYCDFFAKTNYTQKNELIQAMLVEIEERKAYLKEPVSTVYFGGGTPSTFSVQDIDILLKALFSTHTVEEGAEITLEANPDDLSIDYLTDLRKIGVNRLSIGIQSFDNRQLKAINRRHDSKSALECIKFAHRAGFDNISIDLIFGLPYQDLGSWQQQVETAVGLDVQHISAYGLMYEEGTPLYKQMQAGKVIPADDDTMVGMYDLLVKTTAKNGFEQYEISNFAKPGFRSRHNSAYWKQKPYLGIGPSAHSYDGDTRQWNVSSIPVYCQQVLEQEAYFEREVLTEQDKYNDFVMVGLRTIEGIDLSLLQIQFGEKLLKYCLDSAYRHVAGGKLRIADNFLRLTPDGIMISDKLIVDLMYVK